MYMLDESILAPVVASFGRAFAYKSPNATPRHHTLPQHYDKITRENIVDYNMYLSTRRTKLLRLDVRYRGGSHIIHLHCISTYLKYYYACTARSGLKPFSKSIFNTASCIYVEINDIVVIEILINYQSTPI